MVEKAERKTILALLVVPGVPFALGHDFYPKKKTQIILVKIIVATGTKFLSFLKYSRHILGQR